MQRVTATPGGQLLGAIGTAVAAAAAAAPAALFCWGSLGGGFCPALELLLLLLLLVLLLLLLLLLLGFVLSRVIAGGLGAGGPSACSSKTYSYQHWQ
jgi:hypothetical protein